MTCLIDKEIERNRMRIQYYILCIVLLFAVPIYSKATFECTVCQDLILSAEQWAGENATVGEVFAVLDKICYLVSNSPSWKEKVMIIHILKNIVRFSNGINC